jgi:hypothetical protein
MINATEHLMANGRCNNLSPPFIVTCPPTTCPVKVQKILRENVIQVTQVLDPCDQSMQKVEFQALQL